MTKVANEFHRTMANQRKTIQRTELWKSGWVWFCGISYLAMVVFAFCVPPDVLDKYPQAKEFTDFMAGWNVQIRQRIDLAPYKTQADQFVFAALWCVMPLYWLLMVAVVLRQYKGRWVFRQDTWVTYFFSLGGLCLLSWAALGLPYLDVKPRTGLIAIGEITRSVIAPFWVFGSGCVFMVLIYVVLAGVTGRVVITGRRSGR
jgi:hypothetical protein